MDVTAFLDLKPAPRGVFDLLPERRTRPRFMLPTEDGDWRVVTWGAFAKQIRNTALFLTSVGLQPGDRAAVFAPNSVEWMSAALGIQSTGGAMVPIYPANTPAQAAYVARHSDAKVLFVDTPALLSRIFEAWSEYENVTRIVTLGSQSIDPGPLIEKLRAQGKPTPPIAEVERKLVAWYRAQTIGAARDQEDPREFDRLLAQVSLDQVAQMLYTSGTSGNPKGVPLTHRNVGVNGRDWLVCNAPLLERGDVDLLWLPMSHIFGFGEACLGNTLGWTTLPVRPGEGAAATCPRCARSVFMSVPAHLGEARAGRRWPSRTRRKRKAALDAVTGGHLRFCLSGGAGLKREVKEFFHARGRPHHRGLRADRDLAHADAQPPRRLPLRLGRQGAALGAAEARRGRRDPGQGARRCSAATTRTRRPRAEVFTEDGWFKTGDVGRFTDDGFLQIIDRKKDILVTAGGKNVPAREHRAALPRRPVHRARGGLRRRRRRSWSPACGSTRPRSTRTWTRRRGRRRRARRPSAPWCRSASTR